MRQWNHKLKAKDPVKTSCVRCGEFYARVDPKHYFESIPSPVQVNLDLTLFQQYSDFCPSCRQKTAESLEFPLNSKNYSTLSLIQWLFSELRKIAVLRTINDVTGNFLFAAFFVSLASSGFLLSGYIHDGFVPGPSVRTILVHRIIGVLVFSTLILQTAQSCARDLVHCATAIYPRSTVVQWSSLRFVQQHLAFSAVLGTAGTVVIACCHWLQTATVNSLTSAFCIVAIVITLAITQWIAIGILIPDFVIHNHFSLRRLILNSRHIQTLPWALPFAIACQGLVVIGFFALFLPGCLLFCLLCYFHIGFYLAYFEGREDNDFVTTLAAQYRLDYIEHEGEQ